MRSCVQVTVTRGLETTGSQTTEDALSSESVLCIFPVPVLSQMHRRT